MLGLHPLRDLVGPLVDRDILGRNEAFHRHFLEQMGPGVFPDQAGAQLGKLGGTPRT